MRFRPEWSGGFYCVWLGNETPHKLGVIWGLCRLRGGRGCLGEGADSKVPNCISKPLLGAPCTPGCFLGSGFLPEPSPHPVLACPCPGAPRSHLRVLPLSQPTFPGEHSPPVPLTAGHTLCLPALCGHLEQHSVFSTHPSPPPGAAIPSERQEERVEDGRG